MTLADASNTSALLRFLNLLSHRHHRDRLGLHRVEGIRGVLSALDRDAPSVDALLVSEPLLQNPHAQKRVRLARRAGVRVVRVTPEVFRRFMTTERASGLAAVVRQGWTALDACVPEQGLCWVAVGALRSAGNLGTLLRTAEAVGAAGVMFLSPQTDPFDPDVVRASMGGVLRLCLVRCSADALGAWAQRHGCAVVGTSPQGPWTYSEAPLSNRMVVVFGEERRGLTDGELQVCTQLVRIPMVGHADSLNVGVASGVVLFDLLRRRSAVGRAGLAPASPASA